MEDILKQIAEKMTYVPALITYIGILVPIFISAAVLISQILQNKSNKKLQKNIHNHQVELKCFDSVLEIYYVFSESVDILPSNVESLNSILGNNEAKTEWCNSLVDIERKMYRKYDFAFMLLGNENNLVKILQEKRNQFTNLVGFILEKIENESENKENIQSSVYEMSKDYIEKMSYDAFDQHFLNYLNINHFTEN